MRRALVERSLRDVHGRLVRARQELAVLDEQLRTLNDMADDARFRAPVSEPPVPWRAPEPSASTARANSSWPPATATEIPDHSPPPARPAPPNTTKTRKR